MPELPEVQTVVDDLIAAGVVGRSLASVSVHWPKSIATPSVRRFRSGLPGKRIAALSRRGKFIVLELATRGWLLIHLRMSGHLHLVPSHRPRAKHEHVVMRLKDAPDLRFHDPRKFGRLYWVADPIQILGHLGPEPLAKAFTGRCLAEMLAGRRRQLKPLLLDQRFLAGLGNIYVDEALWASGLHPKIVASRVGEERARRLHRAIRRVLRRGLGNGGTTLSRGASTFTSVNGHAGRNREALTVFRRTGQPCLRCRTPIARIIVGQRSSHICPRCQKED
ncbi:MAG: bifunctional DNA-formamidopyrimidine glycosylase/DNA-(apurinic or apyrimidinic site) lyase [Desulfosarcinaceae bacterium]|jgi:formamidopyrimidine-DNA glycosylase